MIEERRLSIECAEGTPSLLEIPSERWHACVEAAGAKVLSSICRDGCAAYLLSESSLFVFRLRVVMLTCGELDWNAGREALVEVIGAGRVTRQESMNRTVGDGPEDLMASNGYSGVLVRDLSCYAPDASGHQTLNEGVREALRSLLPDFECDDHIFDPFGYSINAVRGERYYTIHLYVGDDASCASFETNEPVRAMEAVKRVVAILKPKAP